jgi:hypothetical protein
LKLTRRKFLGLSTALLAGGGFLGFLKWRPSATRNRLADGARGIFKNRQSARYIGERYLEQYPGEKDVSLLLEQIFGSDHGMGPWTPEQEIMDWVKKRIQRDFAEGNIRELQGWICSATELRLCALTALTS